MNIKIHRGLDQIGGCITEIWTDSSRVFIDFGQNLPGNGEQTTSEQDKNLVDGIISQNIKEHQAVFYTHAHEDHVGLFHHIPEEIPQYIGEGAKEILLSKYYYLIEGAKRSGEDPTEKEAKRARIEIFLTWAKGNTEPITIGDIRITPFFCCHSIYDSYMFLIEADGKRIWHTGDYRQHGYMGKRLFDVLSIFAKDIDVLITEGTMLNRDDACVHERSLSKKMSLVMQAFKYVFVLASSTDIERLATIKQGARLAKKKYYVNSGFMNATMRIFTEREADKSHGLFSFHPRFYSDEKKLKNLKREGFVLITGTSKLEDVKKMIDLLPVSETILIYSSWDGYYKIPEQVKVNSKYKDFRDMFSNVVDIHTSGHADRTTIKKVIETVKPEEVICIHKEADAKL